MALLDNTTKRQRAVYLFLRDKIRTRGYGPTVREIGNEFGISSPNGVMCHLKALEKKGLITREPNMSRAIRLVKEPVEERGIPLVGQIAAGVMHEAIEQNERFDVDGLFNKKNHFALKVSGDSMIEDAICDGDFVICKRTRSPKKGDVVVAQLEEGEATLKRFYPERNRVRLEPANSKMKPIYARNVRVLGVVVGVVRKVA